MANPDDSDFEDFVNNVFNVSCSTFWNMEHLDILDMEIEEEDNILLNNISASDESEDDTDDITQAPVQGTSYATLPTPQVIRPNDNNRRQQTPARPIDNWMCVTAGDPGPNHTIPIFNINKGPCLPEQFDELTKPVEYFNDNLMAFICEETNLFANKRKDLAQSPRARLKQ